MITTRGGYLLAKRLNRPASEAPLVWLADDRGNRMSEQVVYRLSMHFTQLKAGWIASLNDRHGPLHRFETICMVPGDKFDLTVDIQP
jgi:hypothetical protein